MKFPGNVTVDHFFKNNTSGIEAIQPRTDGYLGSWSGESNFVIMVEPKNGTYLFWRSAKRNPVMKCFNQIDLLPLSGHTGRSDLYTATIGTSPAQEGSWVTKSPRNHLVMTWITKTEKEVGLELWELAIVAQADSKDSKKMNFFLTIQMTQKSPLFRGSDNRIVAPEFPRLSDEDWNQARRYISTLLAGVSLAPEEPKQATPEKTSELPDNQGRVLWYNLAGNNGIVVTNKGNAKVHWKQIQTDKRFKSLKAGQIIEFDQLIDATDPRTKIPLEVRGVRAIKS